MKPLPFWIRSVSSFMLPVYFWVMLWLTFPLMAQADEIAALDQALRSGVSTPVDQKPVAPPAIAVTAEKPVAATPPAEEVQALPPKTLQTASTAEELGLVAIGEPLVGKSAGTGAELDALRAALTAFAARTKADDFSAVEAYLTQNPASPWKLQLLNNLGKQYYVAGYFNKALDAWAQAWGEGKGLTDQKEKEIADDAFGDLVRMHSRVGHVENLESLLNETQNRDFTGSSSSKVASAKEAVWAMKNHPESSFRCGPLALARLLALEKGPNAPLDTRLDSFKSTSDGTSFEQVLAESDRLGGGYQLAWREKGAEVVTPAIVHWKIGHFGALTAKHGDAVLVKDATFIDDFAISKNALDEEASGYFLVPKGTLPSGWRAVSTKEASSVWGKGQVTGTDDEDTCPTKGCASCKGMATYGFQMLLASLIIQDTPIWYSAGFGPHMEMHLQYNQRDAYQPASLPYANFGKLWTHDYMGFVEYNPTTQHWPASVTLYERGGGIKRYTFPAYVAPPPHDPPIDVPSFEQATSYPNRKDGSVLVYTPSTSSGSSAQGTFQRIFPNATKMTYGLADGSTGTVGRTYLTKDYTEKGAALDIQLQASGGVIKITKLVDAAGKETLFSYANASFPSRITKVTDPFGRGALFDYDTLGRLIKITDMGGLTSEFTYVGSRNEICALKTPYGTTRFDFGSKTLSSGFSQWVEATDPGGAKERMEFLSEISQSIIPASESSTFFPSGAGNFDNSYLYYRNSFYWNKKTMAEFPGDYTKAEIYHWFHKSGASTAAAVIASYKKPLENRVYFEYVGQSSSTTEGTHPWPVTVAKVVKNQSGTWVNQVSRYEYDDVGNPTKITDPSGRVNKLEYDSSKQNLKKFIQVNGGVDEVLWEATSFAGPGMPTTVIDEARQTTTLTWDSTFKKPTSITNAKGEVITLTYETTPSLLSYGKLKTISGDGAGLPINMTYDAYGRKASVTDSDGYTKSYLYDSLDRLTRVTYPNSSTEEMAYNRLDLEWKKDRTGKWTHNFYDYARRLTAVVDPLLQVTKYDWCSCGALHGIVDAKGNATTFIADIQMRTIEKRYADYTGSNLNRVLVEYEAGSDRVAKRTDFKGQVTNYKYFVDDNLQSISYTNTSGGALTPNTPGVSFEYDTTYDRVKKMTDGVGITNYSYHPVTSVGQLGATQLSSIDGPFSGDTVSYTYDQLGRKLSRTVGSAVESYTYDSKGRTSQIINPLGTFGYGYDAASRRLASVIYPPNTQLSTYISYLPNNMDRRIDEINTAIAGDGTIAGFKYAYDAEGKITQWKQQVGISAPTIKWDIRYDADDQLIGATKTNETTGTVLEQIANRYDKVGNRVSKQTASSVSSATYNSLNQLTSTSSGGVMTFEGTVSEPSTVAVGGNAAKVDGNNVFRGEAAVTNGLNNVTISATDPNGNVRTKTAQVNVPTETSRTFTYDPNGNLTADGQRTYEWDAQDRMVAINYVGNSKRSEFTYDGLGRRARVVEKDGSTQLSNKTYIWNGLKIAQERDQAGATVQKDYYSQGFVSGGASYYYARDGIGTVSALVDSTGVPRGVWSYSLWGKREANQITLNPVDSDLSFAGYFQHKESGLLLAPFRTYDPDTARWLSRDPIDAVQYVATILKDGGYVASPLKYKGWIAEMLPGGPSLYKFVGNDPLNDIDFYGLRGGMVELLIMVGLILLFLCILLSALAALMKWLREHPPKRPTIPELEPEPDATPDPDNPTPAATPDLSDPYLGQPQ